MKKIALCCMLLLIGCTGVYVNTYPADRYHQSLRHCQNKHKADREECFQFESACRASIQAYTTKQINEAIKVNDIGEQWMRGKIGFCDLLPYLEKMFPPKPHVYPHEKYQ